MAKHMGIISNSVICVSHTHSKWKLKAPAFGLRTMANISIVTRQSLKSKSISANLGRALPGVVRMVSAGGRAIAVVIQAVNQAGISNGGNRFGLRSTFCETQQLVTLRTQALISFEIRGKLAKNTFKSY